MTFVYDDTPCAKCGGENAEKVGWDYGRQRGVKHRWAIDGHDLVCSCGYRRLAVAPLHRAHYDADIVM